MKLQGRNIILTGASRGFGKYLAGRLWEEGANLLLVARSPLSVWHLDLPDKQGQTVEMLSLNLVFWDFHNQIIDKALRLWDHNIDGLVNNAAIQGPAGKSWEVDTIEWHGCIRLNLTIPVELCRKVAPHMVSAGRGKIVNLSGGGAANPRPNYSAYATAKAGLVRFSETLAEELKGTGIDVNCVAPGKMPTGMLSAGEAADPDSMRKAADLIIFLLSDESNGVTGRLISAVWDNWRDLPKVRDNPAFSDLYTLRRIGGAYPEEPGESYYRHLKETGVIK